MEETKKCEICGKENPKSTIWCSEKCYYKWYYITHKEERLEYFRKKNKENYVPHPIEPKYKTKEERYEAQLRKSREYYHSHKEQCRKKNTEWYRKHKDDENLKRRHALAMKKYQEKKKREKENE